jgi:hypothetical protein
MKPQQYKMPDGYRGDTYISPEFRKVNEDGPELTSGVLVSGSEYLIKEYNGADDFTNVGAAENKVGEIFTASGTTPTTWTGASVLVKIQNISLAGASIRAQIYKNGTLVKTFSTEDDSIEVVDAAKGIFIFANFISTMEGTHQYDIQVTLASGIVSTYFKGTWYFQKDVTKSE